MGPLEDRTLLSGTGADVLTGVAFPIALGTTTSSTLGGGDIVFLQVNPTTEGKLVVQVHAESSTLRLSLLNGQDQVLMQSDGQSPTDPDDLISVDVPAGPEYLELENPGGATGYTVTTSLTPATAPFQPIPLGGPPAIVSGDFTGNGRTDLAVTGADNANVSVLLGNGDGTFQSPVSYAVGREPDAIVAGDFTGDGHTDLAVANGGGKDISVLLGNGDGTFQSQVTYAVGSEPDAILAGDFNGDGRLDLAVANYGGNTVSVLLGRGDGTFQKQVTYAVGNGPDAIVAGNFNGDGRTDLAVANYYDNTVSVLLGNGDGTFQKQGEYEAGPSHPDAIVAGDFNGDGRTDLAVANIGYGNGLVFLDSFIGSQEGTVSVLLGNGDGTFQKPVTYAVGEVPSALVAGDFNGDGRTDLAVANYTDNTVSVLLGNGDGTFQNQVTYAVGGAPFALVAGDFNGDGRIDLGVANPNGVSVLLGNGNGTFQNQFPYAVGAAPYALVAGDFNGDGRTDLAVANYNSNTVSVLLGNGDGTFQNQVTYAVGNNPDAIVAGDFNGDGRTDLAVANYNDNTVSVLLGNGDGTFQNQVTYAVGSEPDAIVAGDFNGDDRTDLAVANAEDGDVSVLLGNGDGTFQNQVTYAVGSYPYAIVAGDLNGDGRTDLAVANYNDNTVSVLLGNGDGTFQNQVTYAVGNSPVALVAGDFNGDGRTDLAVANNGDNTVSVLLGNGDGTFQNQVVYAVGSSPSALVAGDFNGDGRTDLAVANYNDNTVSVLLGNGDGTFQNQVVYAVGAAPDALVTGDFNGDGRTDLATANSGSNNVSLLLNVNGVFVPPDETVTTPHATPLVADLTGDGTDDVFVVNAAGDILWRQGRPQQPGTFDPPVTINPGNPSRDIAAVDTDQGPMLASVDDDDAVSLYAWRDGSFALIGSLPTGLLPAQILAADLTGDGLDDLVVRNAGDGTVSVYLDSSSESGPTTAPPFPFQPANMLPVGPGVSDVTLADVSGEGRTDILVANGLTGEVGVLRNLGYGTFALVVFYRAGGGLYAVTDSANDNNLSATLTTLEATTGVAAGAFTTGGPPDLVAIDPGSNTMSVLSGLGGGRFANPVVFQTASPAIAVRAADLEGNGIPDLIVLSSSGVTVYRGDGKGGFLPDPFTIAAGPDPTGLTVADINGDGKLDLLVSNAYGDLLVLLGNGDGTFQPYYKADQDVALAVLPNGSATPDFIYADQGLDKVVVDYAGGQTNVVADQSSGLLAPGAVALADLNGDGIPDLIVANSGSNNVLVYPGLPNGQFGPELNGGNGFFTGTDPVGITVANLNGRPDLVIANGGSNDVSILLNVATADGGFTFVTGERVQGGYGPTSTVVEAVAGNPFPDLLVSDSDTNQVRLIPGVGGGFFNDKDPTIYSVGSEPSQLMVGSFTPGAGPQILTVNRGSNDVTVISNFNSNAPVIQSFPTGGIDPVAVLGVDVAGNGLESLVIANSGDGLFTLLGNTGADGLEVEATLANPALPEPTALALDTVNSRELEFYAVTAGVDAALALAFILPEGAAARSPVPGGSAFEGPAQLVPLTETSLALVGTLLTFVLNTAPNASLPGAGASEPQAELNVSIVPRAAQSPGPSFSTGAGETAVVIATFTSATTSSQSPGSGLSTETGGTAVAVSSPAATTSSVGQSLLTPGNKPAGTSAGEGEPIGDRAPRKSSTWSRFLPDVDEVFDQIREEIQPGKRTRDPDEPDAADESARESLIDEAIGSLWGEHPKPEIDALHTVFEAETQPDGSVSVGMPLVLAAMFVVQASPLAEALRDRPRGVEEEFDYPRRRRHNAG